MKIAINTRFLLKDKIEGMGRFTYEVVRRMVLAHPEHQFLFFFDRPYDDSFIFADNVTPIVLFPPARHPILFVYWFEWSVAAALKKYQPDVFLCPSNFLTIKTTVPTVLVVHDIAHHHFPQFISGMTRWYYQFFTPKFLRKAAHIVTVSNYTKSDIVNIYGTAPEKISVACNGCSPSFVPLSTSRHTAVKEKYADGKDYFFYIGAIHPRKNVARLIAAYDLFRQQTNSDIKLLLAGRMAWQTGPVGEAIRSAKFAEDIIFLGYVSDEELPLLTGAAFASTYVSLFEGFGIPILEAMQCDVPVLTSNTSCMPEVAGNAGLLVHPESVESIADGMMQLLQPDIRNKLIAAGRKQREKYSWDRAAAIIWKGIEEVSKYTVN